MGVIHKLHPDVIEFILAQRKSDPSIGCRHLADMVRDQLHVEVSKSSVSNILKSMNLSGSVGRKPASIRKNSHNKAPGRSAKNTFEIPSDIKQRVSQGLQKIENVLKDDPRENYVDQKVNAPIVSLDEIKKQTAWTMSKRSTPVFNDFKSVELEKNSSQTPILLNAGIIFLKAAQWCAMPPGFWPSVFQNSEKASDSQLSLWYARRMLKFLTDSSMENDFQSQAARFLDRELLSGYEEGELDFEFDRSSAASYRLAALLVSVQARHIQIQCENGTSFVFDPRMISLGRGLKDADCGLPLYKTIKMISQRLIVQNYPAIFFTAPNDANMSTLLSFHDAFEGCFGCEISSIAVLDQDHRPIYEFSHPPRYRRTYFMGLWPWQLNSDFWLTPDLKGGHNISDQFSIVFQERHENVKNADYSELFEFSGKIIKDYELTITDKKEAVQRRQRVVFVAESQTVLWGVLTNDFEISVADVLNIFLRRWPNGDKNLFRVLNDSLTEGYAKNPGELSFNGQSHEMMCAENVTAEYSLKILMDWAEKMFLDSLPADIRRGGIKDLSDLCGYIQEFNGFVNIVLKASDPEKSVFVKHISQIFNELDIINPSGQRININVE